MFLDSLSYSTTATDIITELGISVTTSEYTTSVYSNTSSTNGITDNSADQESAMTVAWWLFLAFILLMIPVGCVVTVIMR